MTNTLPFAHKYRFIIALILTAFISTSLMASKLIGAPPVQATAVPQPASSPQHSYGIVPAVFKTNSASSGVKGPLPALAEDGSITANSVTLDFQRSMISSIPAPKKEEPAKKTTDPSPAPAPSAAPVADNSTKNTSSAKGASTDSTPAAASANDAPAAIQTENQSPASPAPAATAPIAGTSPAAAQAFARTYLASKGLSDAEFQCLVTLWNHESGWNFQASNASSGAYGIPQSLPGSKMGSVAADWKTNPQTQIIWGLGYISDRYGTPCGAMAIWNTRGWY